MFSRREQLPPELALVLVQVPVPVLWVLLPVLKIGFYQSMVMANISWLSQWSDFLNQNQYSGELLKCGLFNLVKWLRWDWADPSGWVRISSCDVTQKHVHLVRYRFGTSQYCEEAVDVREKKRLLNMCFIWRDEWELCLTFLPEQLLLVPQFPKYIHELSFTRTTFTSSTIPKIYSCELFAPCRHTKTYILDT